MVVLKVMSLAAHVNLELGFWYIIKYNILCLTKQCRTVDALYTVLVSAQRLAALFVNIISINQVYH